MASTWTDNTAATVPCFEAAFSLTWKKLLIMSVSLALSRLLHVSALTCAAVLSLFTCSASPVLTQVDNGVKPSILRALYSPYNQNPPLYLPPETGVHAGTNSETRTRENLREVSSIIGQQSSRQQFSFDQNRPHNKRPGTAASEVWRGHRGGTRPASSGSDSPQPRGHQPVNTDTYYNDPSVMRKSSQTEAGSPFYLPPQFWPPENAPKPHKEAKYPGVFSFKMARDEKDWTYSDLSLLSYPSRGYWTTALLTPRRRCSDKLEANGVQRASVPRAPSFSQRWDAFIKNNPSPEKQTPSMTDVTQGRNSVSGSEAQTHKKARSYLLKDSQTSIREGETVEKAISEGAPHGRQTSAARGRGSVSSSLIRFQQSHREAAPEDAQHRGDAVRRVYGPRYSAHTRTPTAHPPVTTAPSTRPPPLPASDKALGSLAPVRHAGSHDSSGPRSEQPVGGRPVNEARGSAHDRKHAQSTKRLYGFRGFKSPARRAGTEPPVLSEGHRWDKENLNTFKSTNTLMSPKSVTYSFHGASTTTTMTPTHGFKKEGTGSEAHVGKDQNHRQVRVSKKIYGVEGFISRPHEGADASVRGPDEPATLPQDLEGSELRSSQAEPGPGRTSTQSHTKSGDFSLKAAGRVESVKSSRFSPDKYKKHHDSYALPGFQPAENRSRTHTQLNPSADSPAPRDSSADLRPAGGPTVEPSLSSEPEGEAAAAQAGPLHSPTSSVAKASRVTGKRRDRLYRFMSSSNNPAHAAIVRPPKWPVSVPYADIVGSASFSHVRAGEDGFTSSAATSRRERRESASRRPEADAGDDADDFRVLNVKEATVGWER